MTRSSPSASKLASLLAFTLPPLFTPLLVTRAALADPVAPVPYRASEPVPYPQAATAPETATAPAAPRARAATPVGADVVHLKDGGMIRGTLIESIPGDHASVQLATGQIAMIPWARVDHVERGAARPAPAAPAAPVGELGASAWVHVESDRPVRIERHEPDGKWKAVCSSPCDAPLPLADEYRIAGDGMRSSSPFQLAARAGEKLQIEVSPASKGAFVGGIVLTATGPIVAIVGLVLLLAADITDAATSSGTQYDTGGLKTAGTVLSLGGLGMTVGGIIMLASNAHSKQEQIPLADAPPRSDAWLRGPTWREDKMALEGPKPFAVPIFATTF